MAFNFIKMNDDQKRNLMERRNELIFINSTNIPYDLKCFQCDKVAIQHLVSTCGLLFCQQCMTINDNCPNCVVNGMICTWSEKPGIEIRIVALLVNCINRPHCNLVMTLLELPAHLLRCCIAPNIGHVNIVEEVLDNDQPEDVEFIIVRNPIIKVGYNNRSHYYKYELKTPVEDHFYILKHWLYNRVEFLLVSLHDDNNSMPILQQAVITKLANLKERLLRDVAECFMETMKVVKELSITRPNSEKDSELVNKKTINNPIKQHTLLSDDVN